MRIGTAAPAWVLAAGVFAAMLVTSGPVRDVLVPVLAAVLLGWHLVAGRVSGASSWRRVPVLWSVQAGLTWLVAGDPTTTSVLVYIGTGSVFAVLAEVVLRVVGRFAAPADTAPLPVPEGEG